MKLGDCVIKRKIYRLKFSIFFFITIIEVEFQPEPDQLKVDPVSNVHLGPPIVYIVVED